MGAVVSIDYSEMWFASHAAQKAADYCQDYAEEIEKKVTKKIGELKLGGNDNTSQANYFAQKKIENLNAKKEKYKEFSTKVTSACEYAKTVDTSVSQYIKSESKEFRNTHDMKVGVLEGFFAWVTTTVLNSTAFGRWLNDKMNGLNNWIDEKMRDFKHWYHLEGGKYIIKTALAVIGTILAVVFLVCVAWPALVSALAGLAVSSLSVGAIATIVTAVAGVVSAVVSVLDNVTKIFANANAVMIFEDDPGWAQRYSSYSSLSEFLRKNNFKIGWVNKLSCWAADSIDVISTVAAVINIADMFRQGILKISGKQVVFRKLRFKLLNGKMTSGSIKYGLKSLGLNIKTGISAFKNTNLSRIQESLSGFKAYSVIHNTYENVTTVLEFPDKGIKGTIKDAIKSKMEEISITYNFSELNDKLSYTH